MFFRQENRMSPLNYTQVRDQVQSIIKTLRHHLGTFSTRFLLGIR